MSVLLLAALLAHPAVAGDEGVPVRIEDLPPAVPKAIQARWHHAILLEAEREDGRLQVEFVTEDGVRMEVEVDDDGTIRRAWKDEDPDENDEEDEPDRGC